MRTNDPDQTSPMSGWLIALFFGAIDAILLFELGFIGLLFTLAFAGLVIWKGPRLPGLSGLVTGVGLVWTLLLTNVAVRCTIENATPGSGCDAGDIWVWIAGAGGILGLGTVGTVVAARRARAR
jgi:hypothetical protein